MSNPYSKFVLMAAMFENMGESQRMRRGTPERDEPNRCLRPECTRQREYNRMYCSAACNKLDKQRVKELNNPKKPKIIIGVDMSNERDYSAISVGKQNPDGTIKIIESVVTQDSNEFKEMRAYLKNKYPEAIEMGEV